MPDIVLGAQNLAMNQTFKKNCFHGIYILVGRTAERKIRKDIVGQIVISTL